MYVCMYVYMMCVRMYVCVYECVCQLMQETLTPKKAASVSAKASVGESDADAATRLEHHTAVIAQYQELIRAQVRACMHVDDVILERHVSYACIVRCHCLPGQEAECTGTRQQTIGQ
jgi:hypothetical protein